MTPAQLAPYGPNTPLIRRFLVRLAALGQSQRVAVAADYQKRAETPEWARAESALAEVVHASGRSDVTDAIAGPLLQLVRTPDRHGGDEQSLDPVAEPALAALLALAVSDLLPREVEAVLYAPFETTIPRTELQ